MRDLIVHDTRLAGATPFGKDFDSIEVGETTPLSEFVSKAINFSAANQGDIRIKIMAHGEDEKNAKKGGNVLFCQENIRLSTIEKLRPLNGKVKGGIVLYVCRAAMITPGKENQDGDGNMLCSRMAQIVGTTVQASTALQLYYFESQGMFSCGRPSRPLAPIDFGSWEGTVLTYGPKGNVEKVEYNPVDGPQGPTNES